MVDWYQALSVAITGIVSVFLALGILSAVVWLAGYLFARAELRQKQKQAVQKDATQKSSAKVGSAA
ncbi:MAG: OadG family protein [Thermoanaerobacteraceae bacterium]|nr:OadG family protein [Thermoanaerobacteraceae bacterium]